LALDLAEADAVLGVGDVEVYCLVTAEGATCYGGIVHWQIAASTLSVTLDEAAAQALSVDGFRIVAPDAEGALVEAAVRNLTT
jgi:Immunity protein 10